MRIPSPFRDQPARVELKLTPMIDCVFLLLVYFIWSSSFVVAEMSLPTRLSAAISGSSGQDARDVPPPEADFPNVVVRLLRKDGTLAWTVNDAPVGSLAELRQTLSAIANIKRNAPVIIDPAGDVPLGHVIDVFDLSRVAGFAKVGLAADVDR